MQIDQIPLERLSVSALNMRRGRKLPDVSDILPSEKARKLVRAAWCWPTSSHTRPLLASRRNRLENPSARRRQKP